MLYFLCLIDIMNPLSFIEVIFKSDLESIFGNRKWQSYEEEQLLELDKKKVKLKKSSKAKKNDKTS